MNGDSSMGGGPGTGDGPNTSGRPSMSGELEGQSLRDRGLERFVGDLARGQPLRRAPASLEHRVLAQLALQQPGLVWWRRGFTHWPLLAQAGFLLASYGFVRLSIAGVMSVMSFLGSREVAGDALSWVQVGSKAAAAAASTGSFLLSAIPSMWLYGAAAAAFGLYALLFGLGTVAYRTLYVER
jgi:hypothetical protein